jgi:hypothetical protein
MKINSSFAAAASLSLWMGTLVGIGQERQLLSDEAKGKQWWAHVQYLADDSMKGRLTGSEEYLKAAAYVVEKFKSDRLRPAGVDGTFYQPVRSMCSACCRTSHR